MDTPGFWKDILEIGGVSFVEVDRQLCAGVYMNKSVMQYVYFTLYLTLLALFDAVVM